MLPPTEYGIALDDAYVMVVVEFDLTPSDIAAFARQNDGSKVAVKQEGAFSYHGEEPIEFEDDNETLHFFFPRDYAFAHTDQQVVRRFFFTANGKHYMLAGVPWTWVAQEWAGDLIIDPTISLDTTEDVRLESDFNERDGRADGGQG